MSGTKLSAIIPTGRGTGKISLFKMLPTENPRFKIFIDFTCEYFRPGPGKFTPTDIDASLCTHIVYAFAVLDSSRLVMKPHDIWLDVENSKLEQD